MSEGPIVYLNGRMVPATDAHLNIHDMGVTLGATVSEMARTFSQRIFRLEDHLERLVGSLCQVHFDLGLSMEQLGQIAEEVVRHNARWIEPGGELGLVIFVTAGETPTLAPDPRMGTRREPTVCVHTFSLPLHAWSEKMRTGASLMTPSIRHIPPQCIPASVKYRSRIHYYLAEQEARLIDNDAIPLLLDLQGNVTETNTANFFMVEQGTLVSPRPTNILPGISREMVFELAAQLGIGVAERDFDVSAVTNADEALLASTPFCLMPAVRVNGVPVGNGTPGPVFKRLIQAWSDAVGVDIYRQIVDAA